MKTIIRNLFIVATLALVASCSLKEEPTSFVNKHNFYENQDQCYAALNACYIPLNSIYTSNFMIAVEGPTRWSTATSAWFPDMKPPAIWHGLPATVPL